MTKRKTFSIGDRVAFAAAFLKSTSQHTGWAPHARGSVTEVLDGFGQHQLVTIKWDDADTSSALSCNLTLVSRIAVDAAHA